MEKKYELNISCLTLTEGFRDATESELRVLLALIERDGYIDADEIAALTGLSTARVNSALAFWKASGVSCECVGARENRVECEFEEDPLDDEEDEEESLDVAKSIRNGELADVIAECARLMNRPNLNTQEIKHITALWTQLALSGEYILTLAAHMAAGGRLTARRLSREASRLTDRGIDTTEALECYIKNAEETTSAIAEIRKIVGIWGRNLSDTERAHFTRWSGEYGYSTAIISEAFSAAPAAGVTRIVPYMNKMLTVWHEAGCKTVEDCRRHSAEYYAAKDGRKKLLLPQTDPGAKSKAKTPKYADFDSEDALMKALARSYGDTADSGDSAE